MFSLVWVLGGCGSPEPVATGYKKQLQPAAATPNPTPDAPKTNDSTPVAANLANGQAIYTKSCASCHLALASSLKANKTAAEIEAAKPPTNAAHTSIPVADWPTGQKAIDVAAALKR